MKTLPVAIGLAALLCAPPVHADLTTDLVVYYDFEDLLNDPAAAGPDATESGTGSYTGIAGGVAGNAAEFTGTTNDLINIPVGFGGLGGNELGDSFTVSAWYNLDLDAASGTSRFFVYEGTTDYDISYGLRDRIGANGFNDSQTFTNGFGNLNHDDVHTPGTWQHVLQTYVSDGVNTTVTTYIDGVSAGQLSGATSLLSSGAINLGNARNGQGNRAFDGKIDEFAAWNRVLESFEIAQVHQLGLVGKAVTDSTSGYFLDVTSSDLAAGEVTGGGYYDPGTEATITAIARIGYVFSSWTGDFAGRPASFTFTPDADVTATAQFVDDPNVFIIDVTSNNTGAGEVTGSGTYVAGTEATITAVAKPGYEFVAWTGDFAGRPASFTYTPVASVTATAEFFEDFADPDNDTLTNFEEIIVWGTDPNKADTDDDQIPDDVELFFIFTDPLGDDSALVSFVQRNLCPNTAGTITFSGPGIEVDPDSGEVTLSLCFFGSPDHTDLQPLVPLSVTPLADGWEVTLPAPSDQVDSYILLGGNP